MEREAYCFECQCKLAGQEAWLDLDGMMRCRECAIERSAIRVQVAARPEARDDGR